MARMYQWRKHNPEIRKLQRRREKIRRILRERGHLPPPGVEMTEEEKMIYNQIGNDDYTFWDEVKLNGVKGKTLHSGGSQEKQKKISKTYEDFILDRAKQSAQQRGLEFNLTIDDIIIPEYCPLLNVKLTFEYTLETRNTYYSIDRIDSSKGYVKGNVQVISIKANTMKNAATHDELITFAKNILGL
jgi:hypothetical protein